MNKKIGFLEADHFHVVIYDVLTNYQRKVLNFFYLPLIGSIAGTIYTTFYNLVPSGQNESEMMSHSSLFHIIQVKNVKQFIKERESLEAVGLLDTYHLEGTAGRSDHYIYLVKPVLAPLAFFQDIGLSQMLKLQIGEKQFEKLAVDFLLHRFDLNKYQNITKTFDEVYTIVSDSQKHDYSSWWVDQDNKGISLKKQAFNFQFLMILLTALDKWTEDALKDPRLYDESIRYGFFFDLTPEEMKEAIIMATSQDKTIDYNRLKVAVQQVYSFKGQKVKIKKQSDIKPVSNNNIIRTLESLSPTQLVQNKYGTMLTPSEVTIFSELQKNTGVGIGIINVAIVYVMQEKDGAIPNYNYFLKVINTWIRAGVKTTSDAYEMINKEKPKTTYAKGRKVKPVPDWFEKHLKEEKQKTEERKKNEEESTYTLEELEEIFKGSKNKPKV